MNRIAFVSSLFLSLSLVVGCDKNVEGTTPPEDGQTASADSKKPGKKAPKDGADGSPDGGDDGAAAGEDPTKKVCPSEVADYPAPYFEDSVLIRLPKGVTEEMFYEETPAFARLSQPVESVGCVENFPGAMITFMALAVFGEDTGKDLTTWRDETLEAFAYANPTFSDEQIDADKRFYQVVVDVPAAPDMGKADPARALFQLTSANGNMYAVVYESHPDAWNALKQTFLESAGRISYIQP